VEQIENTEKLVFTIYGLEGDNRKVRADVFSKKFQILLKALKVADTHANGRVRHDFLISNLEKSSAKVTIEEREIGRHRRNDGPVKRSIRTFRHGIHRIHDGIANQDDLALAATVRDLADGCGDDFAKGELKCGDDDPLLIDGYLYRQAKRLLAEAKSPEDQTLAYFKGKSIGDFVGRLKLLDDPEQGSYIVGGLSVGPGSAIIECIIKRADLAKHRSKFGERVRDYGTCFYDGTNLLPTRIELDKLSLIPLTGDLVNWRGVFSGVPDKSVWDDNE